MDSKMTTQPKNASNQISSQSHKLLVSVALLGWGLLAISLYRESKSLPTTLTVRVGARTTTTTTMNTSPPAKASRFSFLEGKENTMIEFLKHNSSSDEEDSSTTEVRFRNICLETQGERQVLWVWGMNQPFNSTTEEQMRNIKPALGDLLPMQVMNAEQLRTMQDADHAGHTIEWLEEEYHLVRRTVATNLFHWMQEGYIIHSQFSKMDYDDNKPKRIFHIPSRRKFVSLADLTYVQFVHMLGVDEQRTVHGVVEDLSDKHVDEILDDKLRYTCFANAVLGQIPKKSLYLGSYPMKGASRQSYQAYLDQIRSALSVPTPKIVCPTKVTIILRHLNSEKQSRRIENFDQVEEELQRRNIEYDYLDLAMEPNLKTFRQQIEFAGSRSILMSAHGQALWMSHFLPNEAAVVEILPFGFGYGAYEAIAASHGLFRYTQIEVPHPWTPAHPEQLQLIKRVLKDQRLHSKNPNNDTVSLETALEHELPALLRPGSYKLVAEYLERSLGLISSELSKRFAREQPLWVNVTEVVDTIEDAISYQKEQHCAPPAGRV